MDSSSPWAVQRRPVGSVASVAGRLRWKWLLVCCGPAAGLCAAEFAASYVVTEVFTEDPLTAPTWAGWDTFLLPAAAGDLAASMKQGGAPWYALLSEGVPLALYGLAIVLVARRPKIATVST
jgi:hypothetical protein